VSGPFLTARGLVKSYGGRRVVDELSLACPEGAVLGLLGPNGAGKTTTIRMLYGLLDPEHGEITYGGRALSHHREEIKRSIGVCTQEDTLDYDFTVRQNLSVYAGYFRPRPADISDRVDELMDRFGLQDYAHASPQELSGGFKRRLMMARSIVHEPRVLFLDEPTTGLDPRARVDVWELVAALRASGMAIILTTHYMDEAERLSDTLLVIDEGQDIAHGTTAEVLGAVLGEHVLVIAPGDPHREDVRGWAVAQVGARRISTVLGEVRVPITTAQLAELAERWPDARLTVRPPSLDDLFLALSARERPA
jgi:lipooligosaccharide transport system ATP-binding protein